jgi:hypothetical protein
VKYYTQEDTPATGSVTEPQGASPPRQLELAPPSAAEFVICDHTIEVYFNERTQTLAVAWIVEAQRTWGIDRDNLRGWHRHPAANPEEHQAISAMSIEDIILELREVWRQAHPM